MLTGQQFSFGGEIAAEYSVGGDPYSVVSVDLNNDGFADLATANGIGSLSVAINRGDGTFRKSVDYPAGFLSISVVAGDFDTDGDYDLVVANAIGSAGLYLNAGNGVFGEAVELSVVGSPTKLIGSDVDASGTTDLVFINGSTNTLTVLLNQGGATFDAGTSYDVGAGPVDVRAIDIDRDGKLDLVTVNQTGQSLTILENLGEGRFGTGLTLGTIGAPIAVLDVDVDSDSRVDLLVAHREERLIEVFRGMEDGSFEGGVLVPMAGGPKSLAAVDISGDGRLDVVTANGDSNSISLLISDGASGFGSPITLSVGENPSSVIAVDVDNDGRDDIVTANTHSPFNFGSVSVLPNDGTGVLLPGPALPVGGDPSSVTVADLNGDGINDIITANSMSDDVSVLHGGLVGYAPQVVHAVGENPVHVITADLNNDGIPDIVTANRDGNTLSLLLSGDEELQLANIPVGTGPNHVEVIDIDGDGALDLIALNLDSNSVSVVINELGGKFAAPQDYAFQFNVTDMVTLDYDGDGAMDLAVGGIQFGSDQSVHFLLNNGNGTFDVPTEIDVLGRSNRLAKGDLNSDGIDDLVVYDNSQGLITSLLSKSNGGFDPRFIVRDLEKRNFNRLAIEDIDLDGLDDILASDRSHIDVYKNLGNVQFTNGRSYPVANRINGWKATDLDGSGFPDLVVANLDADLVTILAADGEGGHHAPIAFRLPSITFPIAMSNEDFNADGKVDLAVANWASHDVSILLGQGNGVFAETDRLAVGENPRAISVADVDSDGDMDLFVASFGGDTVSLIENRGGAEFAPAVVLFDIDAPTSVNLANVLGDEAVDIIATSAAFDRVFVRPGNGDGTFGGAIEWLVDGRPEDGNVADVDGDGRLDIVTSNVNGTVSVLFGEADDGFSASTTLPIASGWNRLEVKDFDADGDSDIAVAIEGANVVATFFSLGNRMFAPVKEYAVGLEPQDLTAADLGDDGIAELIVANRYSNSVTILTGLNGGQFGDTRTISSPGGPSFIAVGDFTGDQRVDIATSSYVGDDVSVLRNLGPIFENKADLTLNAVTPVPDVASLGGVVDVEYTVTNTGAVPAVGRWVDSVYLSQDDTQDAADYLLGRVIQDRNVQPNEQYSATFTADTLLASNAPLVTDWQVIVRVDVANHIPESNEDNNTSSGNLSIESDITELEQGEPRFEQLFSEQSKYFSVDVRAGQALSVVLDDIPESTTIELYVARDMLPTAREFTKRSVVPFARQQSVSFPAQASDETFYVLVKARSVGASPANFSVVAQVDKLGILTSNFGDAWDDGMFTLRATGINIDNSVDVTLISKTALRIDARSISHEDGTIDATFDLNGAPQGLYDVEFSQLSEVLIVPDGLQVTGGITEGTMPVVLAPTAIRRGFEFGFRVTWENRARRDVPAPLITVGSTSPFGVQRGDYSLGVEFTFLGADPKGSTVATMRPGEQRSLQFWSIAEVTEGTSTVFADRVVKYGTQPFDWFAAVAAARPLGMPDHIVESISDRFLSEFGSTQRAYLEFLSTLPVAEQVASLDPDVLLGQAILNAWAQTEAGIWGEVTVDGEVPASGFLLTVTDQQGQPYVSRTDQYNQFYFSSLPDGAYQINVEGYIAELPGDGFIHLVDGVSIGPLALTLVKVPPLEFQIDLRSGAPIAGTEVVLERDGVVVAQATTDDIGGVTFAVPAGEYNILVGLEEGGFRRNSVTVPAQHDGRLNVTMASATVVGSVADGALFPFLASNHAKSELIPAVFSGQDFEIHAPAGEYKLLYFDSKSDSLVESIDLTLEEGETENVGVVGDNSGSSVLSRAVVHSSVSSVRWFDDPLVRDYVVNLPVNVWAKIAITYHLRDPDRVKEFLGPDVLAGTWFSQGREYARFVERYIYGPGGVADPIQLRQASVQLERIRDSEHADFWRDALKSKVKEYLELRLELGALALDCGEETTLDLVSEDIFPLDHQGVRTLLYQDGNMEEDFRYLLFYRSIAGGVGHYGSPPTDHLTKPDWRGIDSGEVIVKRSQSGRYSFEIKDAMFHVHDAFDLWPGNLGSAGPIRYATTILLFLEINGRATDIPFDAIWRERSLGRNRLEADVTTECDLCTSANPPDSCENIERPESFDPNDIVGPAGFGAEHHVASQNTMPFMIRFENDPEEATAPAAFVRVEQQLDPDLDWTSFRLEDIGFGETIVPIPVETAFYETRIDLTAIHEFYVDIIAGIDSSNGMVFWEFSTIDPTTGDLPADPFKGFLPPNENGVEGQGFVTYSVSPKESSPSGTRIDSVAKITFDVNDPIDTPSVYHTLDSLVPQSNVQGLPENTFGNAVKLRWLMTDEMGGSGVKQLQVFVSQDASEYVELPVDPGATETTFVGEVGHVYSFYSTVGDNVAHRELAPTVPDATTQIFPRNRYDVDADGSVGIRDLAALAAYLHANGLGEIPNDHNPPPHVDVDGNGRAQVLDLALLAGELRRKFAGGEPTLVFTHEVYTIADLPDDDNSSLAWFWEFVAGDSADPLFTTLDE